MCSASGETTLNWKFVAAAVVLASGAVVVGMMVYVIAAVPST
jgi:hypothetical protein